MSISRRRVLEAALLHGSGLWTQPPAPEPDLRDPVAVGPGATGGSLPAGLLQQSLSELDELLLEFLVHLAERGAEEP